MQFKHGNRGTESCPQACMCQEVLLCSGHTRDNGELNNYGQRAALHRAGAYAHTAEKCPQTVTFFFNIIHVLTVRQTSFISHNTKFDFITKYVNNFLS